VVELEGLGFGEAGFSSDHLIDIERRLGHVSEDCRGGRGRATEFGTIRMRFH